MSNFIGTFLSPNITRAWEIDSDLKFRLAELCEYQKSAKNLAVPPSHGLTAYHEYLAKALLDLRDVIPSLNHLQCLERVLKYVAHGRDQDRRELETVNGIAFDGRRIEISDGFIHESLGHARTYLDRVARA